MKEKQYTIGQIAKICNVSAEQLRHYDRLRILSPKGRGENNGYRYYTEPHIEDIMLIKELKRIGLPLKSIGSLLQDKNLDQITYKEIWNYSAILQEAYTTRNTAECSAVFWLPVPLISAITAIRSPFMKNLWPGPPVSATPSPASRFRN